MVHPYNPVRLIKKTTALTRCLSGGCTGVQPYALLHRLPEDAPWCIPTLQCA